MKVAILAGGKGARFLEETQHRPKPMIGIGGRPILWHVMQGYAAQGFHEFVLALGYKGDAIRTWFEEQGRTGVGGVPHDPAQNAVPSGAGAARWTVDLVDTGAETQTGGRLKALAPALGDETFLMAYADGLSDVDAHALLAFHRADGKIATMVVVHPPARFGHVALDGDRISRFEEKPTRSDEWINAGIFVLEPAVFDYIDGPATPFEGPPLEALAREGELMAFRHEGFWQCMDTMHDRRILEEIWASGAAPWDNWSSGSCGHS